MVDYEPLSRKQPYWKVQDQPWAESHIRASHLDALLRYGEMAMYLLLWRSEDYERGEVERCPVCVVGNRLAIGYDDTPNPYCHDCLGTTFEGGWRARIVRPTIVSDRDLETRQDRRLGEHERESLNLQTTSDFYVRTGDYMLRGDGSRYRLSQGQTEVIRSCFHRPSQVESTGWQVIQAMLEADANAVVYQMPPTDAEVADRLAQADRSRHLALGWRDGDEIRGSLVPASL